MPHLISSPRDVCVNFHYFARRAHVCVHMRVSVCVRVGV
jgi:hypothetical protein